MPTAAKALAPKKRAAPKIEPLGRSQFRKSNLPSDFSALGSQGKPQPAKAPRRSPYTTATSYQAKVDPTKYTPVLNTNRIRRPMETITNKYTTAKSSERRLESKRGKSSSDFTFRRFGESNTNGTEQTQETVKGTKTHDRMEIECGNFQHRISVDESRDTKESQPTCSPTRSIDDSTAMLEAVQTIPTAQPNPTNPSKIVEREPLTQRSEPSTAMNPACIPEPN